MKKVLLSILLLSVVLSMNAQNSSVALSQGGQESKANSTPKQLPPALQELIENMVYVEGGTFTMGDKSLLNEDQLGREKPEHQVTLSPFFICRYEVTQEVWEAVMGNSFSPVKGAKLPVNNICWDECQEFVVKLIFMTGINFRLPTEAEWEFAARGGNKSLHTKYSGSNTIDDVAWYQYNSGNRLHPVGKKSPNELGLYDMTGNVSEWCYDYYGRYDSSAQTNPKGVSNSAENVVRGGSIAQIPMGCHVTYRLGIIPAQRSTTLGFRLAATPGSE